MTGEWEYKLKQIESGDLDRDKFMNEIKDLTTNIVEETRKFTDEIVNRPFPDLNAPCPECNSQVHRQTDGLFECYDPECGFKIKKHIASHELTEEQAKTLFANKRVGPIDTFKSRFGQPFTADLIIEKKKKTWKLDFIFEGADLWEEELSNLSDEMVICEAPVEKGSQELAKVYETDKAFLAPAVSKHVDERGLRLGKTILQKEIPTEQAVKFFCEGKTDLLPGFVSKKGRRFAAHLVLNYEEGKLDFEFAPSKKKKAKKATEGDEPSENENDTTAVKKKSKKKKAKKKSKKSD